MAEQMAALFKAPPASDDLATFRPGPGFARLPIRFDIDKLRQALDQVLAIANYDGEGLYAIPLTRKPGEESSTTGQHNLSGRYWIRPDASYREFAREGPVEEHRFTEFVPDYDGTYLRHVYDELSRHVRIGRMRLLKKPPFGANSFHRDPEARLHIPIHTNPGAVMVINHHCTHMPADGSVYFTDTRAYHTAVNGGEHDRVHVVAALAEA